MEFEERQYLKQLKLENRNLKNELFILTRNIEKQKTELISFSNRIDYLEEENFRLKERINSLEENERVQKERINSLENQVKLLNECNIEIRVELNLLKENEKQLIRRQEVNSFAMRIGFQLEKLENKDLEYPKNKYNIHNLNQRYQNNKFTEKEKSLFEEIISKFDIDDKETIIEKLDYLTLVCGKIKDNGNYIAHHNYSNSELILSIKNDEDSTLIYECLNILTVSYSFPKEYKKNLCYC